MAKRSSVNNISLTYDHAEALYQLKEFLTLWGWTVQGSGDGGSNWSNTGTDYITSRTVMNTLRAWFRIQDPGGRREFVIQRGSTAGHYRVKYSALDKFTGGSPSATQTPAATDDGTQLATPYLLLGAGTDASPTYAGLVDAVANAFYHHMVCYDDALNGVYGFYSFGMGVGLGAQVHAFICDPLATGSFPSADTDPCVLIAGDGPSDFRYDMGCKAWIRMNLPGERFIPYSSCKYMRGASYTLYPGEAGVNPYDGDDNAAPVLWGRTYYNESGVDVDHKGFSARILWRGSVLNYPNVVNPAGDTKVFVGDVLLPWPAGTDPAL